MIFELTKKVSSIERDALKFIKSIVITVNLKNVI
jgi:hypothetical protein